jgi:hypothetical protein
VVVAQDKDVLAFARQATDRPRRDVDVTTRDAGKGRAVALSLPCQGIKGAHLLDVGLDVADHLRHQVVFCQLGLGDLLADSDDDARFLCDRTFAFLVADSTGHNVLALQQGVYVTTLGLDRQLDADGRASE